MLPPITAETAIPMPADNTVRFVEHVQQGCSFCREQPGKGGYLLFPVRVQIYLDAPTVLPGAAAMCVGTRERPGCLAKAVALAKGGAPWDVALIRAEAGREIALLEGKVAALTVELEQVKAERPVTAADLARLLPDRRGDALAAPLAPPVLERIGDAG